MSGFLCLGFTTLANEIKDSSSVNARSLAYATGGMFVPFFDHLASYLRVETFGADHPQTNLESVITKGVVWGICLTCLVITMRSIDIRGIGK